MWSGEPPSVSARADRDGHAFLKCPVLKPYGCTQTKCRARTHPCYYHRNTTPAPPRLPAPPHRARPFRSTQNWPRNSPKVRFYDAQELPLTQSGLKGVVWPPVSGRLRRPRGVLSPEDQI